MGLNSSGFDNNDYNYQNNNLTLEKLNQEILILKSKLEDESSNYATKSVYNQEKAELINNISKLKSQISDQSIKYKYNADN